MILSIDIGGTAVKMGLVDEAGRIHARHESSVCFDNYVTPILTTVIREAKAFLARENAVIEGVGVSATGQIDDQAGVVIGTNGKIPNYEGAQIRRDTEEALGVPVRVLNDANAALGECFAGAAKGIRHVVMLTLGTGVGGGIVLGGQLYGGCRGHRRGDGPFHPVPGRRALPLRQARLPGKLRCHHRPGAHGQGCHRRGQHQRADYLRPGGGGRRNHAASAGQVD